MGVKCLLKSHYFKPQTQAIGARFRVTHGIGTDKKETSRNRALRWRPLEVAKNI